MSRQVWKYEVHFGGHGRKISMPLGARLIYVTADQPSQKVWVYALVNPLARREDRAVGYCGTGQHIPDTAKFDDDPPF